MTEKEQMLMSIRGCRRDGLYVYPRELTPNEQARLEAMEHRRQRNEPLQYILGDCDFMGYCLQVDARVLVPRPETELLGHAVLERRRAVKGDSIEVLDLGTGSGNLSIVLAQELPGARVTAVDISAPALALAKENARGHGVEDRITFLCDDMGHVLRTFFAEERIFDIIVSNPPYIPSSWIRRLPLDVQREPLVALDGGEDGLKFLRAVIKQAPGILAEAGLLALEIGDGQESAVEDLLRKQPLLASVEFLKDYRETPRIATAVKR